MFLLLNSIPIIFSLICASVQLLKDRNAFANKIMYYLPFYQTIIEWLMFPAFLLIVNIYFMQKKGLHWAISLISMIVSIAISVLIDYVCWGIRTGNLFNPDSETFVLFKGSIFIPMVIISVGFIIYKTVAFIKK